MHRTTLAVLETFLDNGGSDAHLYGLQIMDLVSIKSGTLYPILDRLETAGWITGAWGDEHGHARRRYYSLTGQGVREANAAIARRRSPSGNTRPRPA